MARREISDYRGLYRRPGFLLRRAHQVAVGIFFDEAVDPSLTPPQHNVLFVISCCPGLAQSELSRLLGYDRATVGAVVAGLVTKKLIRREDSTEDLRVKTLTITRSGKLLLERAAPALKRTSERILAPLKPADREVFLNLLGQVVAALNAESRTPVSED